MLALLVAIDQKGEGLGHHVRNTRQFASGAQRGFEVYRNDDVGSEGLSDIGRQVVDDSPVDQNPKEDDRPREDH
jgi:hypothetical protein